MDLPPTQSRKFIYVYDNAIACQAKLTEDLVIMAKYFEDWRLRPNAGKTVHCFSHLDNHQANRKLNPTLNGETLEYAANQLYLGNVYDRGLTHRANSERIKLKLKSRVNLIQNLAGSTWGCSAKTF